MAIEIKDQAGNTHEVSSRGTVNAALTTGIIGTALGVLNNGGILNNGLLGGNTASSEITAGAEVLGNLKEIGNCCFVDKDTFWSNLLNQSNENAARDINTERRFAAIEALVQNNSTANNYQNTIISNNMEFNRVIGEKNLALATCRCIQGDVYLSPNKLADNYIAPSRVLDSYVPRDYMPGHSGHGGYHNPHGHNCNPCYGGF